MNIEFIKNGILENKEKTAVFFNDKEYTFLDIYEEYNNVSAFLEAEKIKEGSIVAIIGEYTPKSIAMIIALMERNIIIVPISTAIKNYDEFIRIAECEYIINCVNEGLTIKNTGIIPKHNILLNLKKESTSGLILFSSGTTGEPKAAVHNMSKLIEKFKNKGKVLKTLTFLMFDHIGGFNTMIHALVNGGTIVTVNKRTPKDICDLIEKFKVELLPVSPTFLNMMLLNKVYENYDLSSLKIISYGTEPMPQYTLEQMHKIFPNVKLKQTYGLSELGIMSTKSEASDSLWMKLGGEGFETKIVDDILYIRAKSAMIGYLNAPSPFDDEGWFNTKDKVLQKDGYIKILGRVTDLINIGGEKVYPIEIEGKLLGCDGVIDARVFAEDNPITGKMIIAEVKVNSENNNREFVKKLRSYCKDNLERFKIPSKFILNEGSMYNSRLKKNR